MGFSIFIRLFFNFILERLRNVFVHQKNIVHFVRYFLFEDRGFHDSIVVLLYATRTPAGCPQAKRDTSA